MRHSVAATVAVGLLTAPTAAADPDDRLPYCTSGQTPTAGECKPVPGFAPSQSGVGVNPGIGVGVDPKIPTGLNPASQSEF
jgi:hypothetical protein